MISIVIITTACVEYETKSIRKESEVVIDGKIDDWEGKLEYFDEEGFAIGFQNDEEFLYICLSATDRKKVGRLLSTGITIMFDPEEGTKKAIGIRYPVRQGQNQRDLMDTMGMQEDRAPRAERMKLLLNDQNEFLLVNQEDFPLGSYPIDGSRGFKVKLGLENDYLAYELRIPLIPFMEFEHFVHPNDDGKLLISINSVEMEKPEQRKNPGGSGERFGGMEGGRSGGARGGRAGGMSRGKPGGMDRSSIEPISFEISLELAK